MKKLLFLTLLILPWLSSSQISGQNKIAADSVAVDLIPSVADVTHVQIKLDTVTPEHIWYLWKDVEYSPLILKPENVFYVYVGLKERAVYKARFQKCSADIARLNDLIQSQNEEIKAYAMNEIQDQKDLKELNAQLLKKAVEIQEIKDSQVKWYKSPWLYLAAGFIGGVYMMK